MQMTAELSLYPLAGDVNDNVLAFIEDLVNHRQSICGDHRHEHSDLGRLRCGL